MYNQNFYPFDDPSYMQLTANDVAPSSLTNAPQHQDLSLPDVGFGFPDHWLHYPDEYPQSVVGQQDQMVFPAPFDSLSLQSSGGVLGPPFSLADPSGPPFNQHVDPDYSYPFQRHPSATHRDIPTIRVITSPLPASASQFSPPNLGVSPFSDTSSGSSFPSTPLFPPVPHYHSSPTSSPNTPDYPNTAPQYMPQPTPNIWDIVRSYPPTGRGPAVPQKPYRPHTLSDRKRYVEEVDLEEPITFLMKDPDECGIPLGDALTGKYMRLRGRDDPMFVQRGPSVSIRLKWPGYGNWSRQIPTKDFRSPPGPITRAKLAKNIARTVERFIKEKQAKHHFDPEDEQWRVGPGYIGVNDLILVGLQHVSKGSWQAHLCLARPKTTFSAS